MAERDAMATGERGAELLDVIDSCFAVHSVKNNNDKTLIIISAGSHF